MSDILEEVRAISSQKIAEKQKSSEQNYPYLIGRIKKCASDGKTECEFNEHEIDQYSKRLLENDGFAVYCTTKVHNDYKLDFLGKERSRIWIVRW